MIQPVEGPPTLDPIYLAAAQVGVEIPVLCHDERFDPVIEALLVGLLALNLVISFVTLVVGAYGYSRGWVSLGQITAAVLYVEALGNEAALNLDPKEMEAMAKDRGLLGQY